MKEKNYKEWFENHLKLAREILPNLPQKFRCKRGLCTLVFDRGPRFHSVAYYVEKNPKPLHEERHECLYVAAQRMLEWYTTFSQATKNQEKLCAQN